METKNLLVIICKNQQELENIHYKTLSNNNLFQRCFVLLDNINYITNILLKTDININFPALKIIDNNSLAIIIRTIVFSFINNKKFIITLASNDAINLNLIIQTFQELTNDKKYINNKIIGFTLENIILYGFEENNLLITDNIQSDPNEEALLLAQALQGNSVPDYIIIKAIKEISILKNTIILLPYNEQTKIFLEHIYPHIFNIINVYNANIKFDTIITDDSIEDYFIENIFNNYQDAISTSIIIWTTNLTRWNNYKYTYNIFRSLSGYAIVILAKK